MCILLLPIGEQGFESNKVIEVLKKLNYRGAK